MLPVLRQEKGYGIDLEATECPKLYSMHKRRAFLLFLKASDIVPSQITKTLFNDLLVDLVWGHI